MKKRVFSGIQPTGNVTIGNYLGAIQKWVQMQHEFDCLFCVVDLHALTNADYARMQENIRYNVALYVAAGLDPEKVVIFQQSQVSAHAELAWLLSCITPIGWLNRMTQFKDKVGKNQEKANLGLYAYPVLMAADILLYNADLVPVGEDQQQHIELARDIARVFNRKVGQDLLQVPEALIGDKCQRIMSLKDASKKMSKSDPADGSRINMSDAAEVIGKKIRKATTDAITGISYDKEKRSELANLLDIYCGVTGKSLADVLPKMADMSNAEFKHKLAEVVIAKVCPMHEKAVQLLDDGDYIVKLLRQGAAKAEKIAATNMVKIKSLLGIN
jgi:tryptophanyl-tRNA synthetase